MAARERAESFMVVVVECSNIIVIVCSVCDGVDVLERTFCFPYAIERTCSFSLAEFLICCKTPNKRSLPLVFQDVSPSFDNVSPSRYSLSFSLADT